jgi:hypothetical protein
MYAHKLSWLVSITPETGEPAGERAPGEFGWRTGEQREQGLGSSSLVLRNSRCSAPSGQLGNWLGQGYPGPKVADGGGRPGGGLQWIVVSGTDVTARELGRLSCCCDREEDSSGLARVVGSCPLALRLVSSCLVWASQALGFAYIGRSVTG